MQIRGLDYAYGSRPALRTLRFAGGDLPFVGPATQQWIDEEVAPVARGGGGDGLTDEERGALEKARALAAAVKTTPAP